MSSLLISPFLPRFDVAFIGSKQTVWLSTSPTEPLTHWYQVRCLLQTPIFAKQGQVLTGRVLLAANSRQSYDVTMNLHLEGTSITSSNTFDLKNPYFRYTGAVAPPPGNNTTSPSENVWLQLDAQGARNGECDSGRDDEGDKEREEDRCHCFILFQPSTW